MSEKCKTAFVTILKVVDLVIGIAIIGLGIYNFYSVGVDTSREFFLSFYYIFFGALLIITEIPNERIKACFYLLSFPFGKAMYLLFMSCLTFDLDKAVYLLFTIVYICTAILHTVYMVLFYDPEEGEQKSPQKSNTKKKSLENPGFGKIVLDDNPLEAEKSPGMLQRRK